MNPSTTKSQVPNRQVYLWHQGLAYYYDQLESKLELDLDQFLFHHPGSPKTFFVIQDQHPFGLIQKFFQAMNDGFHPLILDPELDFSALRSLWNLKAGRATSNHQLSAPSFWLATSGSTGRPKLIGHSFSNAKISWEMLKEKLPLIPQVWGLTLPTHHVGGLMVLLRQYFEGHQVLSAHYQEIFNQQIKPDALSLVPAQLQRLSESAPLHQLEFILLGGAQVSTALLNRVQKHQWPVFLGYGSTETCSAVSLLDLRAAQTGIHLGQGLKQVHFSINPQDQLIIDSPTLNQEMIENSAFKLRTGALVTSDSVKQNQDGLLVFQGRTDDIFISGGENISPTQLEMQLPDDARVSHAAIIARDHPELSQAGHLALFLSHPLHDETLRPKLERDLYARFIQPLPKLQRPLTLSLHDPLTTLKLPRQQITTTIQKRFEELKNQPLLVFLHGLFGHPEDFDQIQGGLANQLDPLSMFTPTLPGHERPHQPISSLPLEDKSAFLQRLHHKIQKTAEGRLVILIGYSLGGRVAMELASMDKSCYPRLAILSSHPGLVDTQERLDRLKSDQALASQFEPFQEFLEFWYQQPLFSNLVKKPIFKQRMASQEFSELSRLRSFFLTTSLGQQSALDEKLQGLDGLYLYGELDQKFKALADRYGSLGFKTCPIPHSGHALLLESPEQVAKCLIEWI